jgi:putative hemolysin
MTPQLFDVAGLLAGLILFLFAATAETALGSLSHIRVHQLMDRGVAGARRLELFVTHPSRFVVPAQVMRTFAGVATTGFAVAIALATGEPTVGTVLGTAAVAFAVLTVLLAFPRGAALHDPERTLLALYWPVRVVAAVLDPLVKALNALGGIGARMVGIEPVPQTLVHSPDELHVQTSAAREAGLIEEDEQDMIDSIIELDKTTAREIMVPRIDVAALPTTATLDDALELVRARGYSRVPVYEGSIDNILGVVYAKDLLRFLKADEPSSQVGELLRPAYFIPESKKTDELLRELQKQKVHIAIVADEYGGTAGIVTIEDLLEEIVGEIQDEYDREEAKMVEVAPGEAIFDATVSIDDVNDALDLALEGEDVDTIGGLLYERLGKMPTVGDRADLDGALLQVESTAGRRIRKVRVTRRRPQVEEPTAGAA